MTLNGSLLVHDLQLVLIGGDLQFVDLVADDQWTSKMCRYFGLTGTTPTTLKSAPSGFQHFEHPQA